MSFDKRLSDKIDTRVADVYLDVGFKHVLEQHLPGLKRDSGNNPIEVTIHESWYYQGNFHGLLYRKGIPVHLHWLVTRLNGYDSSLDFNEEITEIILPNVDRIDRLKELYLTTHNI